MGTKTQDELVQVILENLGVAAAGQPVSAEDAQTVITRLSPKNEELSARNICYIPDLTEIDDVYFLPFAAVMAEECATVFGVPAQKMAMLMQLAETGRQTLKDAVRLRRARPVMTSPFPPRYRFGRRQA